MAGKAVKINNTKFETENYENTSIKMEFTPKEARKRTIRLEPETDAGEYPHNLQFYTKPPQDNITLQEFEDFAVQRLKGMVRGDFQ